MKIKVGVLLIGVIFIAGMLCSHFLFKKSPATIKPTKQIYKLNVKPEEGGLRFDVDSFPIEKANNRGDRKIPSIKGTVTVEKDLKKGDIIHTIFTTTPSLIKMPERKFSVGVYSYPGNPQWGFAYGLITLGQIVEKAKLIPPPSMYDVGLNLGFTPKSPVITIGYSLTPAWYVFVGTGINDYRPCTIYGLGIKF